MRNTWSPKVIVNHDNLNKDLLVDEIKELVYEYIANFEKSKSENLGSSESHKTNMTQSCVQLERTGSDG